MAGFSKLQISDGNFIAYRALEGKKKDSPGIIFLGGFRSDMTGTKAMALEQFAVKYGLDFIRFDYFGHGASSGVFEEGGCIGRWKDDALAVLDNLTDRPQILVGSSMGGWLMLLSALERPQKIAGLLGIAAAPDFTENLIWAQMTEAQQAAVMGKGICHIVSDDGEGATPNECGTYPITRLLIEDGRRNLLLRDNVIRGQEARASHERRSMGILGKIPGDLPIKLIHGMADADVPYQTALKIAELVETPDVQVILQKSGRHRMSEREDLALIVRVLKEMLTKS